MDTQPKLLPEQVCLIGIRSYEQGEADLLKQLNVRVFDMDEVNERGIETVFAEALAIVKKNTAGYGLSIDMDAMDPNDAPGVGTPEPGGIAGNALCATLANIAADKDLVGFEIVEFNPNLDQEQKTEKLVVKLLKTLSEENQ